MPRFGKQFKVYNRILPSPILDVTDIIEDCKLAPSWPRIPGNSNARLNLFITGFKIEWSGQSASRKVSLCSKVHLSRFFHRIFLKLETIAATWNWHPNLDFDSILSQAHMIFQLLGRLWLENLSLKGHVCCWPFHFQALVRMHFFPPLPLLGSLTWRRDAISVYLLL